jgi:hypothetical protein
MKKDVIDYITRCMECEKVKANHKYPASLLQAFPIPKWKWEVVIIDFIAKFSKITKKNYSIMVWWIN